MQINAETHNQVRVLTIAGSIDALTAEQLQTALMDEINAGQTRLIADLGGVDYTSSAGLRAILGAQKEIRALGGDLRLANVQPNVLKVLKLSGFTSIFKTFDDTGAAIVSFNQA